MSQNLICLDLGSQNLHMVYGKYNKGNIVLHNAANFPIPEGVFKDGKIEDFQRLKESIRILISDNKIKEKNVVLTIQSTSIITRDIMLPAVERQQLDNMVMYEIEQYLPISEPDKRTRLKAHCPGHSSQHSCQIDFSQYCHQWKTIG